MKLRPYGERATLVEVADTDEVLATADALRASPPRGLVELVPAATSVLAIFADADACRAAREALAVAGEAGRGDALGPSALPDGGGGPAAEVVQVEVRYDGDDLSAVADACGLRIEEVVARHTAPTYRVAFCGFVPGFSYLVGLDERLQVPRLATPRTRVPAGAVGIAGPHTAVYPRPSPGGWSLLGRTELRVWDLERDPPTPLTPGTRVRFAAVGP